MPNFGLTETNDITFSWKPNSEANLSGYKICCGIQSRSVADYDFCEDVGNPPLTGGKVEYVLSGLTENQDYFCSVRAYADTGKKSGFCNEINFIAEPVENTWSATPPEEFPTWQIDYNGDGIVDTLYVDNQGMWLSRGSLSAIPEAPILLSSQFANWDPTQDVIYIVKFDEDQWYDIVGFGYSGVYVSWGIDGVSTSAISCVLHEFGYQQGWRVGWHKRDKPIDINGDNLPDIVGMGELGIMAAYNNGDRTLSIASDNGYIIHGFGYNHGKGWLIPHHIRRFVDIDEDGAKDFVGIGNTKMFICWGIKDSNGFPTGTFTSKEILFSGNFCNFHGWKKDKHLRIFRNMDGKRGKEFVGFGDSGVVVLKNIGGRLLQGWSYVTPFFGRLDGWGINNIRVIKDVNSDGRKDFSGWKNGTHYVVLKKADGSYGPLLEWH